MPADNKTFLIPFSVDYGQVHNEMNSNELWDDAKPSHCGSSHRPTAGEADELSSMNKATRRLVALNQIINVNRNSQRKKTEKESEEKDAQQRNNRFILRQ